jgi:hypothetical protein
LDQQRKDTSDNHPGGTTDPFVQDKSERPAGAQSKPKLDHGGPCQIGQCRNRRAISNEFTYELDAQERPESNAVKSIGSHNDSEARGVARLDDDHQKNSKAEGRRLRAHPDVDKRIKTILAKNDDEDYGKKQ